MKILLPTPRSGSSRTVGLFVVVALTLLALLLVNFSKGASFLTPSYSIIVKAQNVGGLKREASVLMAGVPVGNVEDIDLTPDGRSVQITCRILKRFKIHGDARWEIEQSGFLGDQFVSIVATTNALPVLPNGAEVTAQNPFNIQEAARSASSLMQKLDHTMTRIDAAVDRVDRQLLTVETLTNLTATIANLKTVSSRAESAIREVESFVRDQSPSIGYAVSNFTRFSDNLSGMGVQVSAASTNFNSVLTNANRVISTLELVIENNQTNLQTTLSNLSAASESVRALTADLQAGKGLAGGLLKDESMRTEFGLIVSNMTTLSSNLSRFGLFHKPKQVKPLTQDLRYPGRTPLR